jgi:hypothetical protein
MPILTDDEGLDASVPDRRSRRSTICVWPERQINTWIFIQSFEQSST